MDTHMPDSIQAPDFPVNFSQLPIPQRLEFASRAIAACMDMGELKKLDNQAAALVAAVKASKMTPEIVSAAIRVKNEALFRLGEILMPYSRKVTPRKGLRGGCVESPLGEIIRTYGIKKDKAYVAVRLASGGPVVRKKVISATTSSYYKLSRLVVASREKQRKNAYKSDFTRIVMNATGGKGLSQVLYALRHVVGHPLRQIDPLDKPRVRSVAIECQELIDEILQQLE